MKKVLIAVENIYTTLSDIFDFIKLPIYKVKEYKEVVINLIQEHSPVVGYKRLLCWFKISSSTFQNWLLELKIKCSQSYFSLCVRKYGNQLSKSEIELMREALTSEKYLHWPIVSIAHYFQRINLLHVSCSTWYSYRKRFGIIRKRIKKTIKKVGIITTRCNEYWHIDITYFTTKNGVKHCIYFLSDNFSKKILAWRLSFEVNWKFVRECIEDAHKLAVTIENPLTLSIVTDGGPENIHHSLDKFIGSLVGNIKKKIALKDIKHSNSPAEAKNKTFKSYYADESKIENTNELEQTIIFFVTDFNAVRPNHPLKGFTPDEVYFNDRPDLDFAALRKQSAIKRKSVYQNSACNTCGFA